MDGRTLILLLVNGFAGVLFCLLIGKPVLSGLWAGVLVWTALGWFAEKKGWL